MYLPAFPQLRVCGQGLIHLPVIGVVGNDGNAAFGSVKLKCRAVVGKEFAHDDLCHRLFKNLACLADDDDLVVADVEAAALADNGLLVVAFIPSGDIAERFSV